MQETENGKGQPLLKGLFLLFYGMPFRGSQIHEERPEGALVAYEFHPCGEEFTKDAHCQGTGPILKTEG